MRQTTITLFQILQIKVMQSYRVHTVINHSHTRAFSPNTYAYTLARSHSNAKFVASNLAKGPHLTVILKYIPTIARLVANCAESKS